jgi:hypothetical protein
LKALLHHESDHAGTSRAERHPNTDLAAALGHHVGEHTVRPDGREQQRQSSERAEKLGQQPRPPNRFREYRVHVLEPHDRDGRVHLPDHSIDRS